MFIKLLSPKDKKYLLELLELLAVSDKPLLWDGKRKEEITSETNLDKLSIQKEPQESELIADLASEGNQSLSNPIFTSASLLTSIENKLVKRLKTYPIEKIEEPATRAQAAVVVLKETLSGEKSDLPSVPKLMLFELISLALCRGSISNIKWTLLKEFQHHYKLEDFIFDDLLERAETISREVNKTIAIILE